MTVIRTVVAIITAVMLAGCLPVTTKTPVGTTVGLKADPALYGTWKGHNVDEKDTQDAFAHFMKAKDGSITIAVVQAFGVTDDGWSIYTGRTATLGSNHILNVSMVRDNGEVPDAPLKEANFPLLYVVKGRTLTLYIIDEDKARAAITAGTIKGTIEPGTSGDVTITADAKELDAFMAKPEAAKLFKVMLVLKKVE